MTPMRLQRALARAGVTSRRKAEDLIRDIANLLAQQEGLPEPAGP